MRSVDVYFIADDASEANPEDGSRVEAYDHEHAAEIFMGNCFWEYESNSGIEVFVCKEGSEEVRRFDCEIEYEPTFYCSDVTEDHDD